MVPERVAGRDPWPPYRVPLRVTADSLSVLAGNTRRYAFAPTSVAAECSRN